MSRDTEPIQLVEAIRSGDDAKISREWGKLQPILKNYLIGMMGASSADADDCIQQSMMTVIEKVNEGSIQNPQSIKSYLFQCCKRNYLRIVDHSKKELSLEEHYVQSTPGDQLERLVESQNKQLMEHCIAKLNESSQHFIYEAVYNNKKSLSDLAKDLQISPNAAWTRKHRIINKLIECVQKLENTV